MVCAAKSVDSLGPRDTLDAHYKPSKGTRVRRGVDTAGFETDKDEVPWTREAIPGRAMRYGTGLLGRNTRPPTPEAPGFWTPRAPTSDLCSRPTAGSRRMEHHEEANA